ncbi:MAG: Arc family DNA-binding protein [Pseudomonadota bacterium]
MEELYRSQFRLPYSLYEQLKASADQNQRSVNAELVAALQSHYRGTSFGIPQVIEQITQQLDQTKGVSVEININIKPETA